MSIDLKNLEMLFFDIGNIFVSDDPAGCYLYRKLYDYLPEDKRGSFSDFFALRTEHIRGGGNLWTFIKSHVREADFCEFRKASRRSLFDLWAEMSPEIPGMADMLRQLAKCYRIGLIANQPAEIEPLLEARGLLDLFEVRAVSEVLEMDKPDPRIFQWAMEKAGLPPERTMMIGDRIDNDIKPAKGLGMKTLWLRMNFETRGWKPETEFQTCYVKSLLQASVCAAEPTTPDDQPDLIADSPPELLHLLGC